MIECSCTDKPDTGERRNVQWRKRAEVEVNHWVEMGGVEYTRKKLAWEGSLESPPDGSDRAEYAVTLLADGCLRQPVEVSFCLLQFSWWVYAHLPLYSVPCISRACLQRRCVLDGGHKHRIPDFFIFSFILLWVSLTWVLSPLNKIKLLGPHGRKHGFLIMITSPKVLSANAARGRRLSDLS